MKDSNKMRIAGKLTIQDWEDLNATLDTSKNKNWGIAFNFFEQRITTRYLNPIHAILNMKLKTGEGFAVVNLQCSLIETIECFYNGWVYNYPYFYERDGVTKLFKSNKIVFESFFQREPFKNYNISNTFYSHVRCGLLHETQTKKGWIIKDKHDNKCYEEKENEKIIYRTNFQSAIEKIISNYKIAIVNESDNEDLRKNFIAKFNHICCKS